MEVSATANWYFMIASPFMLGLSDAFIVRRFTILRTAQFAGIDKMANFIEQDKALTPAKK
jgi:aminobenzoyl-glutamate transport protein